MQQEQISTVYTPRGTSPEIDDVFINRLIQRLVPALTRQATATRTKLVSMSWVLGMLSLIVLGCLTYLFLSQGAAGISAGGVQLGAGLSSSQQLIGIAITSLAVILVNIVFNIIAFRGKR